MSLIRVPKGTRDIWGEEIYLWHKVEEVVRSVAYSFQYEEIRTPFLKAQSFCPRSG